jgi:diguanylate cyclase (GGDEF)-like protein/PAS domain S-box-containing protein
MNGKPSIFIRTWVMFVVMIMIAVAAITVIVFLIKRSDDSNHAENALLHIEEKAVHISALEWQAIAQTSNEGSLDPELVAEVESENNEIDAQFAELGDLQADSPWLSDIQVLYDQYLAAVRQEMSLLGEARLDEVRSLDEQQVDQGYLSLEAAIEGASEDLAYSSHLSILGAYVGTVFTGIATSLIIGLIFWRFDLQRSKVAAGEVERKALSVSEKYFRSMVENSSDVVMILSDKGAIQYISDSAKRVLLYKPDDMAGNTFFDFVLPEDSEIVEEFLEKCVKNTGTSVSIEYRFRFGDRSWGYLESTGNSRIDDPTIGGIVVNSRNITNRKQAEEALRSMSLTDDLTGLYNHRGFKTLAKQQLLNAHRVASPTQLLFIDLDDMKLINDIHGHIAGDRALVDLARVFRNTFRESDILGRVGGDEFAILVSDTSVPKVNLLVERLHKNLEELNVERKSCKDPLLYISLGIADCKPTETCILDELLARADALMYEQKRGKNPGRATGGV